MEIRLSLVLRMTGKGFILFWSSTSHSQPCRRAVSFLLKSSVRMDRMRSFTSSQSPTRQRAVGKYCLESRGRIGIPGKSSRLLGALRSRMFPARLLRPSRASFGGTENKPSSFSSDEMEATGCRSTNEPSRFGGDVVGWTIFFLDRNNRIFLERSYRQIGRRAST